MKVWHIAFGGAAFLAGALVICGRAPAQTAEKKEQSPTPANVTGPKKPVRHVEFATTTDPVALLAVRRSDIVQTPALVSAPASDESAIDPADPIARKAAEIAETERLIKDKQKKIVLLLRLFATDEQMFIRDPSAEEKDASIKERRKYAQDELLWETAELSRLKKRLNELESSR